VLVALAAAAVFEVVFQVHGLARGVLHGADRLLRKERAAEVGMQHRAGEIEDTLQRRTPLALQNARCALQNIVEGRDIAGGASVVQRVADGPLDRIPAVGLDQVDGMLQDTVHGRQRGKRGGG
jgi:hypothetical protein